MRDPDSLSYQEVEVLLWSCQRMLVEKRSQTLKTMMMMTMMMTIGEPSEYQ